MRFDAIDLSGEATTMVAPTEANRRKAWLGREIEINHWLVPLDNMAVDEIAVMVAWMKSHPLPMLLRTSEDFSIPSLRRTVARVRGILDDGCGFAVIDRLPMDDFDIAELIACFWVVGQLVGPTVAQKWQGTMLYDVTDTGQSYGYGVRGSITNVELVFHNDNAFGTRVPDYVGLLCEYPALEGGISRFCSLYTMHQYLFDRHPELLRRLHQPMYFDRQAEHEPGAPKTLFAPFFSWRDDKLAARASVALVRKGYEVAGKAMDIQLNDALKAVEEVSANEKLWYEAAIERGQIQYLNNHEIGHYRSEFKDHPDPRFKRHLYRTWHRCGGGRTHEGNG